MGYYLCVVLILAMVATNQVLARSGGAPEAACGNIMPQHTSVGNMASGGVPFIVDISALNLGYVPGQTYSIMLTGSGANTNFRGFLIQGRIRADGTTPAGTFAVDGATNQQTRCSSNSGATHVSSAEKTAVQLTWTAPSMGTGPIFFRYAFVDNYRPFSSRQTSVFWAGQETDTISEVVVTSSSSAVATTSPAMTASTSTTPTVAITSMATSTSATPAVTSTSMATSTSATPTVTSTSMATSTSATPTVTSTSMATNSSTRPTVTSTFVANGTSATPTVTSTFVATNSSTRPTVTSTSMAANSSTTPTVTSTSMATSASATTDLFSSTSRSRSSSFSVQPTPNVTLVSTATRTPIVTPAVARKNIISVTVDLNGDLQSLIADFTDELETVLFSNGVNFISVQIIDTSFTSDNDVVLSVVVYRDDNSAIGGTRIAALINSNKDDFDVAISDAVVEGDNDEGSDSDGLSGGAIAAIVIGIITALVVSVVLAIGILYFIHNKWHASAKYTPADGEKTFDGINNPVYSNVTEK